MELKVKGKQENPLLHRTEIILEVKAKTTPSRKELIEKIAELENSKRENVIVDKIKHCFGREKTIVTAKVYENTSFLKEVELEYKIAKNFPELKQEKKKEKEEKESKAENEKKGKESKEKKEEKKEGKDKESEEGKKKNRVEDEKLEREKKEEIE